MTHSVEQAASKLATVKIERAAVELAFAEAEQICYAKFFVNDCLDHAKEKRRGALAYLRAVEIEAEYFQRKTIADNRDRAVEQAVRQFELEEAALAAKPAPAAAPLMSTPLPPPKANLAGRKAAQAARQARLAAADAADAPKRAANAAEFEKRRIASEERQKKVAEKQAEKAAKGKAQ
jgi:type IV secretory pathway VirB10-like protein